MPNTRSEYVEATNRAAGVGSGEAATKSLKRGGAKGAARAEDPPLALRGAGLGRTGYSGAEPGIPRPKTPSAKPSPGTGSAAEA
jgi:hypothetical protein